MIPLALLIVSMVALAAIGIAALVWSYDTQGEMDLPRVPHINFHREQL